MTTSAVVPNGLFDSALDSHPNLLSTGKLNAALPQLLTALYTQHIVTGADAILNQYANGASMASSGPRNQTVSDDEPVDITEDKVYTRPNGAKYYARTWGDQYDVEVLQKAAEAEQYVMMLGAPGTGKTALAEAAFGDRLITFLGSGETSLNDLLGGFVQMPDGSFQWVDGPLTQAVREGRPFLLDEIGLVPPENMSGIYGILDGRRELFIPTNPLIGTIPVADGFYFLSATNPNAPGVRLSEAMMSRHTVQVEVTTDWVLVSKMGVPANAVSICSKMDRAFRREELSWAPQFREALAFKKIEETFNLEFALRNLIALAPTQTERNTLIKEIKTVYGLNLSAAEI
jgi:nitric oxide reductase NorQ protein